MTERRRRRARRQAPQSQAAPAAPRTRILDPIEIPAGDPLEAVLLSVAGPVNARTLDLDSAALRAVRRQGIELIVPLIGQGELLGALYLGPRLSDQPYSTEDQRLLGNLASQVAPAIKVAQLVQEQQAEAKERERIEQELKVAALIQQTLLPRDLPSLAGWNVDAFYRPAREVGGDFYDFIQLDDGRLGVVIGDVTDKGVPAALVMATSRSMLRACAQKHAAPGRVLAEVNDTLVPEIPPAMFVTCLYAIVDTSSGDVVFANAGHNLPYVRTAEGVTELRATGMPLGLMPGMDYEERTYHLDANDVMVLTSDGITEAHDPHGEMYGFSRLIGRIASRPPGSDLVSDLVGDLEGFSGPTAEQEDDITLVVVRRAASAKHSAAAFGRTPRGTPEEARLADFELRSEEGNERLAIERVVEAVAPLALPAARLERLKTAVGEAVMNAIEHGNANRPDLPVGVTVLASKEAVTVRVSDQGDAAGMPDAAAPDIEAKLAGLQTPRGWGLFLIGEMVDEVTADAVDGKHVVQLVLRREEPTDAG